MPLRSHHCSEEFLFEARSPAFTRCEINHDVWRKQRLTDGTAFSRVVRQGCIPVLLYAPIVERFCIFAFTGSAHALCPSSSLPQ